RSRPRQAPPHPVTEIRIRRRALDVLRLAAGGQRHLHLGDERTPGARHDRGRAVPDRAGGVGVLHLQVLDPAGHALETGEEVRRVEALQLGYPRRVVTDAVPHDLGEADLAGRAAGVARVRGRRGRAAVDAGAGVADAQGVGLARAARRVHGRRVARPGIEVELRLGDTGIAIGLAGAVVRGAGDVPHRPGPVREDDQDRTGQGRVVADEPDVRAVAVPGRRAHGLVVVAGVVRQHLQLVAPVAADTPGGAAVRAARARIEVLGEDLDPRGQARARVPDVLHVQGHRHAGLLLAVRQLRLAPERALASGDEAVDGAAGKEGDD